METRVNGMNIVWEIIPNQGVFSDVGVFAYRLERENGKTSSGIVTKKDLDKLLTHGKLVTAERTFLLVNNSEISSFEKYGWYSRDLITNLLGQEKPKMTISQNPLTDHRNGDFDLIEVLSSSDPQVIMEATGELHCAPILLTSHVETELHDDFYKLDEFAEALSKRDDVAFFSNYSRWANGKPKLLMAPLNGDEEGVGGIIQDIEHHLEDGDATPDEKEEIQIIYFPKKENIESLMKWNISNDPSYRNLGIYNIKRYIVRNILEGESFMTRPYPVEEEAPKRKFKN